MNFVADRILSEKNETLICQMIDFLINNIYIKIGNHLFRQCIGIPMGTNCAPLLANLFFLPI